MSGVASKIAQERAKAAGLGSINNPVKFADQDFIKLKAECLAANKLFEDSIFPAAQSSLGKKDLGPDSDRVEGVVWKRPSDIKKNPVFIVGGAAREDIRQGDLGNCWLLAAIACLTMNQDCLFRVIPQDQSFDKDYAGIFHFMLWQYGEWVDVVVDDRLPTKNNRLKFVKSKSSNEFWSPLLEKAYAKINGSYEALIAGYVVEPMEDFTAGVGEVYELKSAPPDLFQKVQRALMENCLVACTSAWKKDDDDGETASSTNIISSHIYTITRAEEVPYDGGVVQIIQLRNPWGYLEWNGPWSDNSVEWVNVDPKVKAELHHKADDGETWMPFTDFLREYGRVEICDINLSEVCCGDNYKWCLTEFSGSWKKGSSAGGKVNLDTFWMNPQYRITLEAPDGDTSKKCPIIVSLSQKDRRKHKLEGVKYLHIGFYIYKIEPSDKVPLGKEFFENNKYVAGFDSFRTYRDVSKRFELLPGDYVIVPAIFHADSEADFYLRVFTEKPTTGQKTEDSVQANIFEPTITPETDSVFEIVKDELQKREFNENEVKNLLNKMSAKYPEIKSDGFSTRAVRQLIKLMDEDNTRTLSTDEFKKTWLKVENYRKIFKSVDADNTETISAAEFRQALHEAGFTLNIDNIDAVVERSMKGEQLDFVQFVASVAHLETLFKMFKTLDPNQKGSINLSVSEFLSTGLA